MIAWENATANGTQVSRAGNIWHAWIYHQCKFFFIMVLSFPSLTLKPHAIISLTINPVLMKLSIFPGERKFFLAVERLSGGRFDMKYSEVEKELGLGVSEWELAHGRKIQCYASTKTLNPLFWLNRFFCCFIQGRQKHPETRSARITRYQQIKCCVLTSPFLGLADGN